MSATRRYSASSLTGVAGHGRKAHEVRTATDGALAVEQADAFAPEIIFMDLGMPRLDGFEAARRIRASAHGASVRIVALTGWGQESDRQRTREAGMEHHLTKPVSLAALQSLLEMLAPPRRPGPVEEGAC